MWKRQNIYLGNFLAPNQDDSFMQQISGLRTL